MRDTLRIPRTINAGKEKVADSPHPGSRDPYVQEQFRVLRSKLVDKIDSLKIKVVGITSSISGEGKTVSALNLAACLAKTGDRRILLLDADLRKADVSRILDLEGRPGLGELLAGKVDLESVIFNSFVPGFFILPAGRCESDPSDLYSQGRFRNLMKEIVSRFDIVLIDTAPILAVSDTVSIRDAVDAFVLVFRTKYTPYTMLEQAVENIGQGNILGVVLNGLDPPDHKDWMKYFNKYYMKERRETGRR